MIGVRRVAGSRLSRRHNSLPLIPGNIRSRMISAGGLRSLSASVSPASPVEAVIAASPSRSRLYFRLSEMSGSSSMIRTGRCISSLGMFYECCLGHVDRQLADIRNVVTDAFDVLRDQQEPRIASSSGRFADHQLNEAVKYVVIELVNLLIPFDYLAGRRRVIGSKRIQRRAQHRTGMIGHPLKIKD